MQVLVKWPPKGKYVLAVSGGADSMALLDLMAGAAPERGYQLVVAHFDHGLRPDSSQDRQLVQRVAADRGLPFVYHEAHLGRASEAAARTSRYNWLEEVRATHSAAAVITAHHQDDLIETSLLNLARGSGRRGLAPLQGGPVLRPLLSVTRAQLRAHAESSRLAWRDDPTNADLTNPRNYLRHRLLATASAGWHKRYLSNLTALASLNQQIDQSLSALLSAHRSASGSYTFLRPLVRELSLTELAELLIAAAHELVPGIELEQRVVRELALFIKTARPHRRRPLRQGVEVTIEPDRIVITKSTS